MFMTNSKTSKSTFAAGCFWGVEAAFQEIPGVLKTQVGYTGGKTKNPSYEQVCTDTTLHAEAVEVEFDSSKVSFETLLDCFWSIHDPTTANRQGPDEGSQYRSAIFYHSEEQKKAALTSKEQQQKKYKKIIVTEIVPAITFYRAEEYHQNYFGKRGAKSCHL